MAKYIDVDKMIAEIERRKNESRELAQEHKNSSLGNAAQTMANEDEEILSIIDTLQQYQPEVDLENYISNKLRELGADLINHKPYSFNRGLNVGKTNAYNDILDRLNARKEEKK